MPTREPCFLRHCGVCGCMIRFRKFDEDLTCPTCGAAVVLKVKSSMLEQFRADSSID